MNMRTIFTSHEKGFTLLEVVFAVSILAIGIMGYTSLKVSTQYSWVFAKNLSQALQLTGANLEGLLSAGFNDNWMSPPPDLNIPHTEATANSVGALFAITSGDFIASGLEWTVKDKCPSQLTKLVTYTTFWAGDNKSLTLPQVQVRP